MKMVTVKFGVPVKMVTVKFPSEGGWAENQIFSSGFVFLC